MADGEPYLADKKQEIGIQGSNQSGMRDRNERLVLTILRRQGPMPKAEIARKTGLSAQTVSVIMRALERDGLLVRGEKLKGRVGQPSVPMQLAPDGAYFFGLKVGRRSVELVLVDFVGEVRVRKRVTYHYPTPDGTLEFVKTAVDDIVQTMTPDQRSRLAGLGISSPYFLWEWAKAIGVEQSKMEVWRHCDLRQEIATLFDFPVFLGNDATCACGGELVFGSAKKPTDFLHLYMGFFIGGGIVLNGNLYTGRTGNAGAIGPLQVLGRDGKLHQLVDVASLFGLEKRLMARGQDAAKIWSKPTEWDVDEDLLEDWLNETTPALVQAIISAISVMDFSAVIIDGSLPNSVRTMIVARVQRQLATANLSGLMCPDVIEGTVGVDARPLGAASLALSNRYLLEN